MDGKDCCPHALLGVKDDANLREIRRAYRARLLRAHPDHGGTSAELAKVMEAYKALLAELPEPALEPGIDTRYGPSHHRGFTGSYSTLAARRYAQSAGPVLRSGTTSTSSEHPSADGSGGFSDVLKRALQRVEELQVELLVPDYSI